MRLSRKLIILTKKIHLGFREVVKTILHARDPLFFLGGGGGLGKRPWVCTDRWGGWVRDHGSVQTGGGDG